MGMWQPAGSHDFGSGEVWAVIADINKRLALLVSQVQELNKVVYEEWRKTEGGAPK